MKVIELVVHELRTRLTERAELLAEEVEGDQEDWSVEIKDFDIEHFRWSSRRGFAMLQLELEVMEAVRTHAKDLDQILNCRIYIIHEDEGSWLVVKHRGDPEFFELDADSIPPAAGRN